MRALLVVNHRATTTSRRSRDVLVRALRSEAEVEVAYTARRGHAAALARQAALAGVDVVAAHGGDGTVNEVVNGLMAAGADASERPALAVVPGGSTNVFARALGLPRDWAEAAGVILEALRESRARTIGLGRADERYFTFCAGLGIDAAVVRRVEQARFRGRTSTPGLYLRATAGQFLRVWDRPRPSIALEWSGTEPPGPEVGDAGAAEHLATVIVQNTAPWTFLGDHPIDPNPGASFDLGLDVLALRALRVPTAARTFGQMFSRRLTPHGKQVLRWHDLSSVTVHSTQPLPFQLDGDYLGERQKVQLIAVPQALRVLC
jgi:diacylglycerol kinase family enzyme